MISFCGIKTQTQVSSSNLVVTFFVEKKSQKMVSTFISSGEVVCKEWVITGLDMQEHGWAGYMGTSIYLTYSRKNVKPIKTHQK